MPDVQFAQVLHRPSINRWLAFLNGIGMVDHPQIIRILIATLDIITDTCNF